MPISESGAPPTPPPSPPLATSSRTCRPTRARKASDARASLLLRRYGLGAMPHPTQSTAQPTSASCYAAHLPPARRYACFYVTRTCFNYVNPLMLKDAALGVDLTAVGFISSLLPIAYAFSKGISGFLGSTMSPRLLLSGGLAATGLTCLGFGFGQGVTWFAAFWTLNGLLQVRVLLVGCFCRGCVAWPRLAKGLTHATDANEAALMCRAWARPHAQSC